MSKTELIINDNGKFEFVDLDKRQKKYRESLRGYIRNMLDAGNIKNCLECKFCFKGYYDEPICALTLTEKEMDKYGNEYLHEIEPDCPLDKIKEFLEDHKELQKENEELELQIKLCRKNSANSYKEMVKNCEQCDLDECIGCEYNRNCFEDIKNKIGESKNEQC